MPTALAKVTGGNLGCLFTIAHSYGEDEFPLILPKVLVQLSDLALPCETRIVDTKRPRLNLSRSSGNISTHIA